MGRKEGGSLFHQMINAPDVFIYSHRTDKDGNAIAVSDQTRKDYQNWLHKSADYFKGLGIRRLSDIDKEKILYGAPEDRAGVSEEALQRTGGPVAPQQQETSGQAGTPLLLR